jgi:Ricin-type beta-trefoil lectin domain-like
VAWPPERITRSGTGGPTTSRHGDAVPNNQEGNQPMSRTSFTIKKIALALAATATASVGLAMVNPTPAAASGITVRLAPASNPFVYVDVSGASTQAGAAIIQWPYNGGQNQVWTLRPAGTNYEIVNKGSGQCITTDGVAGHWLYQSGCNGSAGQQWSTSLTPGNLVTYTIGNPASGLYMDVEGASGSQGAHLDGWYRNGGWNQLFLAHAA